MNIITDMMQLAEVASAYDGQDFAFDVETVGDDRLNHRTNQVTWLALATSGRVDVIPMGHPNGEFIDWEKPLLKTGQDRLDKGKELRPQDYSRDQKKWVPLFTDPPSQLMPGEVFSALESLFDGPQVKVAHNLKFDAKALAKYLGAPPSPPYFDTMIASFLLEPDHEKGLDKVLARVFDYQMAKGIGKKVEHHGFDEVARYAGLDVRWTWLLADILGDRLGEKNLWDIFDLEMDTLHTVIGMELHGVRMDLEHLGPLKDSLVEQLERAAVDVYRAAGVEFNINSNAEKQKILFDPKDQGGQGLKVTSTTPSGAPSVAEDVLQKNAKNPVCKALLAYTDIHKLLTTYVTPYAGGQVTRTTNGKQTTKQVSSLLQDGRVFGTFNQIGAETGRFSSSNPNLQNVPNASTDNGRAIRNLFLPDEGHLLIVADYAQIEPRIIASLADEKTMIQAFLDGEDIYTAVAEPLGVERKSGKELVLSIAYGIGDRSIAERLGCKVTEARDLRKDFNDQFPSIEKLRKKTILKAKSRKPTPYVTTFYGRRRPLPELLGREEWQIARGERQAFNTLIQGTAADVMKKALNRTKELLPDGCQLVLTVHDELSVTAPTDLVDVAAKAVTEAMTGINDFKVPLEIDLKVVGRWGEAK